MKYIKTYETSSPPWVDDYALLDVNKIMESGEELIPYKYCKITGFRGTPQKYEFYIDGLTSDYKQYYFWINVDFVLRKLKPTEIKDFITKKDALKYNL